MWRQLERSAKCNITKLTIPPKSMFASHTYSKIGLFSFFITFGRITKPCFRTRRRRKPFRCVKYGCNIRGWVRDGYLLLLIFNLITFSRQKRNSRVLYRGCTQRASFCSHRPPASKRSHLQQGKSDLSWALKDRCEMEKRAETLVFKYSANV